MRVRCESVSVKPLASGLSHHGSDTVRGCAHSIAGTAISTAAKIRVLIRSPFPSPFLRAVRTIPGWDSPRAAHPAALPSTFPQTTLEHWCPPRLAPEVAEDSPVHRTTLPQPAAWPSTALEPMHVASSTQLRRLPPDPKSRGAARPT